PVVSTLIYCFLLFVFFFQAEDGIRDFHVTGVQTCALPIFSRPPATPNATCVENNCPVPDAKEIPALANAKTGSIIKATIGCNTCSSLCNGGMAWLVVVLISPRR